MVARSLWYRGCTEDPRQWLRPVAHLLLLLTSTLILAMPATESLCNWDHLLSGGSDVEFTLLAGLLFAALVVLAIDRSMAQPLAALLLHGLGAVDSLRRLAWRWLPKGICARSRVHCPKVLPVVFAGTAAAATPLRI